jgi:hypothetical protein
MEGGRRREEEDGTPVRSVERVDKNNDLLAYSSKEHCTFYLFCYFCFCH